MASIRFRPRQAIRVLAGLLSAAVAGAGVMLLLLLALSGGDLGAPGTAITGVVILSFWGGGAVLAGLPLWAVLHRLGLRSRRTAWVAGAGAAGLAGFIVLALLTPGSTHDFGALWGFAQVVAATAVAGAVAGRVFWSIVYAGKG